MGTPRNSNGQRKELHHRLRKTWKHYRDQLQRVSFVGELGALYRRRLIKSPDEWATTKQACRDELVAFFFLPYIYIYIKCKLDVRKTVLNTWK